MNRAPSKSLLVSVDGRVVEEGRHREWRGRTSPADSYTAPSTGSLPFCTSAADMVHPHVAEKLSPVDRINHPHVVVELVLGRPRFSDSQP